MKKIITILSLFIVAISYSQAVVINELDCDTPGIDYGEFVELKSATPNFALDGYVLVFFNGSSSGGDSSYFALDLDGAVTDVNGLLLIGSDTVTPYPQVFIGENLIQNGADAIAIYQGNDYDFPEGTLATTTNLVDALVYDTSDADDTVLMSLLGVTEQINEGPGNNTNSIQRNNDGSYTSTTPTPRQLNDGSGVILNALEIAVSQTQVDEGASFDITFTAQSNVDSDYSFSFVMSNQGFDTSDYTGNTSLTILSGQNQVSTTITLIDDALNEGDEEPLIRFDNLPTPLIPFNNNIKIRVVDNDFVIAPFGTPVNPTFGVVSSTQPTGYYDSLDGLSGAALEQALQDIIADPTVVRAQTYTDVIDILKEADQNPENSNQIWMVYTEQGRAKLDFQTNASNIGKWNREHTFPRSLAGYNSIEADDTSDGIDIYWTTEADSLRHGNSDAHALRAVDGQENSSRGNQHYGQYTGPSGNLGSFKGDVARSVLYMQIRYNGLSVVNGYPSTTGQMGDLATILDWHRNDPPDDFEMNRNNVVYNWQFNRNPFIDQPDLIEYIWGNMVGETWEQPLSVIENNTYPLVVFPNPASDNITIKGLTENAMVSIINIDGKKVLSSAIKPEKTKIHYNLESGMYLVIIETDTNRVVKKLVIK